MIDFEPTEEQMLVLDTVDRFMARHLPPEEQMRRDAAHAPPYELVPALAETGLLALPFPEEAGGLAGDWRTVALVQERLGYRGWMMASLFNRAVGFGGMSLLHYGTEAQKAELLPRIMQGGLLVSLALTEPEAGSDAAAVRTRAEKVEGGWLLSGTKTWCSDAKEADYMVVVARSTPGSTRHEGLSNFLVPPGLDGIAMSALHKVGNHCLPSYEVAFNRVFVPDGALMGEPGRGFENMGVTLKYARCGMAAATTGVAQRVVDLAVDHARERVQFGKPISKQQVIAHRLVDMQTRVDQSRLLVWQLAWAIATGRESARLASQAKVVATETLHAAASDGMQILASAGYSLEGEMQRHWRDSRLYTFGEGSNEIQRNIIARTMGL